MKSALGRMIIFLLFFILLAVNKAQAAPAQEQRLALVIGNAAYEFSPLKNPANDASDIATTLQKLGFKVILKKNVNIRDMEASIQDFGNLLKRGGVGLFYFAGHGLQVNGLNYLIPVGARIDKESDVKYEAVDTGKILDAMANASNGLNIVILDACRDNPFARQFRSMSRGLAILSDAPRGSYISYSTGPGQVAQDGVGRNSPFAAAFMQFVKEPGLTIEQVFKNVRHRLNQDTLGKQVPWELSSLEGDFFFVSESAKSALTRDLANRITSIKRKDISQDRSVSETDIYKDAATGMEFVLVNGGCFQMGDSFGDGESHERPAHEVCLDSYYIGKYEVTQGQWLKIMKNNPSYFKKCGETCPVEGVTWTDIQAFLAELNSMSGSTYRLPTEAEWEYAARDRGKQEKWFGTSSEIKMGDYAWYDGNSEDKVHPVGLKKPNGLGIYDMTGNVWEWTQDRYGENYYQASSKNNPRGPEAGKTIVLRGGSWMDRVKDTRTTQRYHYPENRSFRSIGFRLVKPVAN